ncbi:MAG: fibronectin type III domain-containing protein [bacterium]|nr:fibronectin type III domain-containing protein [bacterium]
MRKTDSSRFIPLILAISIVSGFGSGLADMPEYPSNPYTFPIEDEIWGYFSSFFTVDLNGDGLLDFTYRSKIKVYAYDHWGVFMWSVDCPYPGVPINNHAAKHAAGDVDGDGTVEVVALHYEPGVNQVVVLDGASGAEEGRFNVSVGSYQMVGHVQIVNLRGEGDRDIIVQTMDVGLESDHPAYYYNRTLIAYRMDTKAQLWRVEQDRNTLNGYYEGYWGPAHGPFMAADVDNDGRDEVVGAGYVDHTGAVYTLSYPSGWVGENGYDKYVDHIDAVTVGDFRPDLPGLEWIVVEEDNVQNGVVPADYYNYHTAMLKTTGILWRKETTLYYPEPEKPKEPQNVAAGNFTSAHDHAEVWLSSRGPLLPWLNHQHPWMFNATGTQIVDYNIGAALPAGFNPVGNSEGVEPSFTIDWFGLPTDQIASLARHANGNLGVLDPMTGSAYWSTTGQTPAMQATLLYVVDVAGDSREEIVSYDSTDFQVKIYWNTEPNPHQPKPSKWDDPLYARVKQNWNYYQPGSYTYGDYPLISNLRVEAIGTDSAVVAWDTDVPATSQVEYGPTASYGSMTAEDLPLTTDHRVIVEGLDPYAEYHFRVFSKNEWNKLGMSADNMFRTHAALLTLTVYLEGPYDSAGDSLAADLNAAGRIPLVSPYAEDPDSVTAFPENAVDWVLVQLRTDPNEPAFLSRSAILLSDGSIVDPDSLFGPIPLKIDTGFYYIVVRHRNHLPVMSASALLLTDRESPVVNLSAEGQIYGTGGTKQLRAGLYGMWAGDVNLDGQVTTMDYTAWYNAARLGASGYLGEDINLDGQATTMDYTMWYNNARLGAASRVP